MQKNYQATSFTILIVEDNHILRQAMTDVLKMSDYNVLVAEDGKTSLSLFKQHQANINLILLDFILPDTSGLSILKCIRKSAPTLPIIILSGYELKDLPITISNETGFMGKPFNIFMLLDKVKAMLSSNEEARN